MALNGYKTVAANGALAALPIVDMVVNNGDLVSALLKDHGPAVMSFVGLVNVVLRWMTTTPIFKDKAAA